MSDPFIGEIRMFGGTFAPLHWAFCHGNLLAISSNEALFALIGTTYGGDGRTSFGLPDMRSRVPMHQGTGPGLTPRNTGERFGTESVTLTANQIPNHNHQMMASANNSTERDPAGMVLGTLPNANAPGTYFNAYVTGASAGADKTFLPEVVADTGGNQAHTNIMPGLGLSFIIALAGVYPSRD